jgi:ribose/xylose/arabinose/galactoside ABC-type transport system permease subunit
MNEMGSIGKMFIVLGSIFFVLGIIIVIVGKLPFFGKLPGDFSWKGKNWNVYFPLGTSILLSILLSLILYFIRKFKG